ncbi:MAG TPA: hypothetical protein GX526_01095 [Thermoanaerobacterales bacterium]|nr:hypothetical protein [Thermoanaerobacterales bacterium]
MTNIDRKFIINLQEKDYVTYEGLLDLAHQKGLKGIKTDIIQLPNKENGGQCIMKAIAITEDSQYEGYGDADPTNVNRHIAKHIIRMAETRAKARALRDLTNVGMTAFEELDLEEVQQNKKGQEKTSQFGASAELASSKQLNYIYNLMKNKNFTAESMTSYINSAYNKNSSKELTKQEASELIDMLSNLD